MRFLFICLLCLLWVNPVYALYDSDSDDKIDVEAGGTDTTPATTEQDRANARTGLGLGTAAILDAGIGANNLIQLDGNGDFPFLLDFSFLTGSYNHAAQHAEGQDDAVTISVTQISNLSKASVGLALVENVKHAYAQTIAPPATADSSINYAAGYSLWVMTSGTVYTCTDDTVDAAVWVKVGELDTDDQGITEFTLTGTDLTITLEDDAGGQKTVDLSSLQDGTGTDDQTAAEVTVADPGGYFAASEVEAVLQEIAATLADLPTFGTAAQYDVGIGANNIVQLTAGGELPFTIDAGDLTDTGGVLTHTVEVNNLEADGAAGIADGEVFFGNGAGTGTYRQLLGTDVAISDPGGYFTGSDAETALQELGPLLGSATTPLTTNAQLQAAISLIGTGGGVIYLAEGTFTPSCAADIAYDFELTDGVTLVGSGQGQTILKWPDNCDGNNTENRWHEGKYLLEAGDNMTIRDLTLDGNHYANYINARTNPGTETENQTITNLGSTQEGCGGVLIVTKDNVFMDNIEIRNTSFVAVSVPRLGSNNITLQNSYIHDTYAYDTDFATNSSGLFVAAGDYADEYDWALPGGFISSNGATANTGIRLINNHMYWLGFDAINIRGENVQVIGGEYSYTGLGTFTNDWAANGSGGLYFSSPGKNISVTGALITHAGELGLQANGADGGSGIQNIVFSGNTLYQNEEGGIGTYSLNNATVVGNSISENGQDFRGDVCGDGDTYPQRCSGIWIKDVTNSIYAANNIFDEQITPTQAYGIYAENTNSGNTLSNNVFGTLRTLPYSGVSEAEGFTVNHLGDTSYTFDFSNSYLPFTANGDNVSISTGSLNSTAVDTEVIGIGLETQVTRYSPFGGSLSFCHYETLSTGTWDDVQYQINSDTPVSVTPDTSAPCTTVSAIEYPAGNVTFKYIANEETAAPTTGNSYIDDVIFSDYVNIEHADFLYADNAVGGVLLTTDNSTSSDRGLVIEQTNSGAQGANFEFHKTRSGGAVVDNDFQGGLIARAHDGTAKQLTGYVYFRTDGTVSTGQVPTEILFYNMDASGTGNVNLTIKPDRTINLGGLANTYTGGNAYVCVNDAGDLFASESACP